MINRKREKKNEKNVERDHKTLLQTTQDYPSQRPLKKDP